MGALRCVPLDAASLGPWDDFVRSRPDAWLAHRAAWSLEIVPVLGHRSHSVLAVDDSGRVRGVLPLSMRRSWIFGPSLVSVSGASWAGVLADCEAAAQGLALHARDLARQLGARYVELRDGAAPPSPFTSFQGYCRFPILLGPAQGSLAPDERTRRRLAKGKRTGLQATISASGLQPFFELYVRSMARLGSPPLGMPFFEALARAFPDSIRFLLVSLEDEPVAADLLAFWNGIGGSLFAGASEKGRQAHADLVAIESALVEAARLGCTVFDLGRSPAGSGGQIFKEHWPVATTRLNYWRASLVSSSAPDLDPDSRRWQLARCVWRQLPARWQSVLGARIAPHLL